MGGPPWFKLGAHTTTSVGELGIETATAGFTVPELVRLAPAIAVGGDVEGKEINELEVIESTVF